jgi:hypothetical protein
MKQHEREYFISRLRSGVIIIRERGLKLKVYTPTIEEEYEANQVYADAYDEAFRDEVMGEEEMLKWMQERGLWTEEHENKAEGLKKDIERLKIEIFNARNNEVLREHIRKYIRAGETQLGETISGKHIYDSHTREGLAAVEKLQWLIQHCSFLDDQLYDFDEISLDSVITSYQSIFLNEAQVRELAREEPWRSEWSVRETAGRKLFKDNGRMLSVEQKNIIIWSQMYDNIQESMDTPSDDVIKDDDMLDGWFIIQKKKREKETAEQEFEDSVGSEKIKNADEVFVMANTANDAERVRSMNDLTGVMRIKERAGTIKNSDGVVQQLELKDEKRKMQRQSNRQFKDKFGG